MKNPLFITYKCNWDCSYCITQTHKQNKINTEDIIIQVESIKNQKVSFSGGEPGMVPIKELEKIIFILINNNCRIFINTNGEFFKHKHLLKYITWFNYHCSENLDNIVIPAPVLNTSYTIVVSESNYINLELFMENNKYKFTIYGADLYDKLNKIDGIKIWNKYKHRIDPSSKKYLMTQFTPKDYRAK